MQKRLHNRPAFLQNRLYNKQQLSCLIDVSISQKNFDKAGDQRRSS